MKTSELYKLIKSSNYKEVGSAVNYIIAPAVDSERKIVYLLFQESCGRVDWWHNLAFIAKAYKMYQNPRMTVHHGFADAYLSANDTIMEELLEFLKSHPGYTVVIAGWSLGGAMAILAAEDLNYRTRTDKNNPDTGIKPVLYTYGAPKVAADDVTALYISCCIADESAQFAHKQDIVTHMPPFRRFRHIIEPTWIGPNLHIGTVWGLFNPWKYHTRYDEWLPKYKVDREEAKSIVA